VIRGYVSGEKIEGFADDLYAELEPAMERAVTEAAEILDAAVHPLLQRRGEPIAGGPPAKLTGELDEAIKPLPIKKQKRGIRGGVGVWVEDAKERHEIAKKAAALEYGGTDKEGRYHPPYSFMRVAEEKVRDQIEARLEAL
jgi:hypothetical protein